MIDVHGHIGRMSMDRDDYFDVRELLRKMNGWGIETTCILPLTDCAEGRYLESTTEDVIAACSLYPKRLVPFCLIDPRFGGNTAETDFTELLDEYKERGCVGLGEMIAKLSVDDPRALNLYRQAGRIGMPVLFDMNVKICYGVEDAPGLPRLERALQQCPETTFIGHGPAFWADISGGVSEDERRGYPKGPIREGGAVPRLIRKYPNLWADLSAFSAYNALTRDPAFGLTFLDEFQDKLMFGTDVIRAGEDSAIVHYIKKVRQEKSLSEEAYSQITRRNAVRLLKLPTVEHAS